MNKYLALNLFFGVVVLLFGTSKVLSYDIDQTQILSELLNPQENPSIQLQALRRELLKKIQESLEKIEDEEDYRKTLARWNSLQQDKRNLQSLARNGYIKTRSEEEFDPYKRSIFNQADNEEFYKKLEGQKRGIGSLARNGELRYRKELDVDNLSDKRHIGSLARSYDLPLSGKRSLSSLAKSGDLFKHAPQKRSAGTFGKQALSENKKTSEGSKRGKRQVDYYYENGNENYSPVYQNAYDYDDLIQDLHEADTDVSKRFLGSVAKTGWFRPSSTSTLSSKYLNPDKRHIGSLARLGWLPSFRHIRRFNRSGRSASESDTCREASANGEAEIDGNSYNSQVLLRPSRRPFRLPEENGFIRRVFYHPLTTKY